LGLHSWGEDFVLPPVTAEYNSCQVSLACLKFKGDYTVEAGGLRLVSMFFFCEIYFKNFYKFNLAKAKRSVLPIFK